MVQMDLFTKQKYYHRCKKKTNMGPGRKGGGINWEIGVDIYTLLHIKWLEKIK